MNDMNENNQKRAKALSDAIGMINEGYVSEASPTKKSKLSFRRRIGLLAAALLGTFAVVFTNLWLFLPFPPPEDVAKHEGSPYYAVIEQIYAFQSQKTETSPKNNFQMLAANVKKIFRSHLANGAAPEKWENDTLGSGDLSPMPDAPNEDGTTGSVEITDNQVAGVKEGDRIKRTESHIFYLDKNVLRVYSIAGEESAEVGAFSLETESRFAYTDAWEIYLSEDGGTVIVVMPHSTKNNSMDARVTVASLDVSIPARIRETNRVTVTGGYISSRITNGSFLLLTEYAVAKNCRFDKPEEFLPTVDGAPIAAEDILLPDEMTTARYTVACLFNEKNLTVTDSAALLSYTRDIYVSRDHIFASCTRVYRENASQIYLSETLTEIAVLGYKDGFEKKGSVTISGYLKDRYSMDEYEGVLRVVTTSDRYSFRESIEDGIASSTVLVSDTSASLYCIDLETLTVTGAVERFAPKGETVRSVRFDGTVAYVCTAIQVTDPVFFFDLSDPKNITYKDTGNIEGFSTSLVDFGDYLLGIGQDASGFLKVEIYEEGADAVHSVAAYIAKDAYYATDYKSYYIDRESGTVGIPTYTLTYTAGKGHVYAYRYLLLYFDGYSVQEVASVPLPQCDPDLVRGVVVYGDLYVFAPGEFFTTHRLYTPYSPKPETE